MLHLHYTFSQTTHRLCITRTQSFNCSSFYFFFLSSITDGSIVFIKCKIKVCQALIVLVIHSDWRLCDALFTVCQDLIVRWVEGEIKGCKFRKLFQAIALSCCSVALLLLFVSHCSVARLHFLGVWGVMSLVQGGEEVMEIWEIAEDSGPDLDPSSHPSIPDLFACSSFAF